MGFRKTVELLNRLREEGEGMDATHELASLFKNIGAEQVENLVRIMRIDFDEASRLIGTHLVKRIVSEALASITPLKNEEVENFLRNGKIGEVLSRRSTPLLKGELSVSQAYSGILEACRISGKGSIGSKARKLASLLNRAGGEEAAFIVRMLLGYCRPVSDETILRAVGEAFYGLAEKGMEMMCEATRTGDIYKMIMQAVEDAGRAGAG